MKKLIASLLVLVFGATMVMAEVPGEAVAASAESFAGKAALAAAFIGVEGLPLSVEETENVKGEGAIGVAAGIIVGYMAGVVGYGLGCAVEIVKTGHSNPSLTGMITSVTTSMVSGAMFGLFTPLP